MAKLRHIILIVSTSLVFWDQVVPLWVVSHSLGLTLLLPPWTSVLSVLKFGVTFNVLRCLWGVSVLQVHWRTNHAWSGCCWNPCICLNHWSLLRYHIPWRWRRFTLNKWVPSSSERLRHLRLFSTLHACLQIILRAVFVIILTLWDGILFFRRQFSHWPILDQTSIWISGWLSSRRYLRLVVDHLVHSF